MVNLTQKWDQKKAILERSSRSDEQVHELRFLMVNRQLYAARFYDERNPLVHD